MKNKLLKGIEKFNEIRVLEAKAELVEIKGNEVLVRFSGHMCFTCGTYDYFEDLIYEAKDCGIELKIKDFKRDKENSYLVTYQIKGRK